jgi:signal transduction histidine kinase
MDIDDQKKAQALLDSSRVSLESAVRARTAELLQANSALRTEIVERRQAEAALRASEDKLRKLSAHLQSAREAERAAMAREIHDELGASLTAVKMDLTRYVRTAGDLPAASRRLLEGLGALVEAAIQVVRRIATQLRPSILDHLGLWPALEWQIGEFEHRYGVACSIAFQATPPELDKEAQTALFRIVQEALTNIARHAGATRVQVTVGTGTGRLFIDISDNGIGLPAGKVADPASCGLQGMQERALALGGVIRFDGSPDRGTRLTVSLPLTGTPRPVEAQRETA